MSEHEKQTKDMEASLECLKRLVPHNWQMPSGEPFPVEKSITRQAFHEGIAHAESKQAAKAEAKLSDEESETIHAVKQYELTDGEAAKALLAIIDRLTSQAQAGEGKYDLPR